MGVQIMEFIKDKKIIGILVITFLFISGCTVLKKGFSNNILKYIASDKNVVTVYSEDFKETKEIPRGSQVKYLNKRVTKEDDNALYEKIEYNKNTYLVLKDSLKNKYEESVLEKSLFVRTPVTVYKDKDSSEILSMIKKGEEVEILDFVDLKEDGSVLKYNIKYNDITGYVYGKYLVGTQEEALKNYDESNSYVIHSKRGNSQGGGSAANLDFYPREKSKFENNVMPDEVRSLYLNTGVIKNIDEYINLAKENNMNALVIDIKDSGSPGYNSKVMEKYSPTNYSKANNTIENYKEAVKKAKDAGLYVIGRITVFKDTYLIKDHPEVAIVSTKDNQPFLHNSSYWPSAYNRQVWEFNVELAKEAVREMGFNEIQFDYVRFPDRVNSLERDGVIDMKNIYNEEKAQAIQGFLMYATDELHALDVYVSADVFGESAHTYVTGYGQYWGAISNVVDVISPMPYPDHFNAYEYDFKEIVWTVPGKLLNFWAENYVQKRQKEIPTPAIVRTWIQAYNAIRSPYIEYNTDKISEQIEGLYSAGLTGGYMPWNAASSLSKYKEISEAFKKNYR